MAADWSAVSLKELSESFWDMESSGMTTSGGGIGKTTAEMKAQATFTDAGWDFLGETVNGMDDLWRLCQEGIEYPSLAFASSSHGDYSCPDGMGMDDLMVLAQRWMATTPSEIGSADGNGDGIVNLSDLGILSEYWMMIQIAGPGLLVAFEDGRRFLGFRIGLFRHRDRRSGICGIGSSPGGQRGRRTGRG